jgi:predicted transposase YbfD/YdcC
VDWLVTEESAYYFCDLIRAAAQLNPVIRGHWGVENRTHYVRDNQFQEDAIRIRRNPCMFGLLRSFALNLMRFNEVENISQALNDNTPNLVRAGI